MTNDLKGLLKKTIVLQIKLSWLQCIFTPAGGSTYLEYGGISFFFIQLLC